MKKSKILSFLLALVMLCAVAVAAAGCKEDVACEHTYGVWMLTENPTDSATGSAVRICSKCSFAETTTVAKLSDTSVWTPTRTEPTHTAAGKIVYSSAYGTVTVVLDKLEEEECSHTYGDWQLTKAPTATETGTAVRVCSKCLVAESADVAALTDEAVWTATTTPATHTADGETVYASVYGTVKVAIARLADQHTFDKEVVDARYLKTAADCHNAAVYYKTCECGAVGTDTFTSGEHLAHVPEEIPAVAATCTSTGLTAGSKCSLCGEILTAQEETEKTAHTPEEIPAVDATCTSTGLTAGSKCSLCGEILTAQEETEKTAHTPEEIPAVDATCSSTGLTAGSKCSVCGEILTAQKETEKTAHTPGNWQLTKAPTETEVGSAVRICSVCKEAETKDDVPVLADDTVWKEERVNPTTATKGVVVYTSVYGTVRIELDKLPEDHTCEHDYGNWIITKEPTAEETGRAVKICSKCGVSQEEIVAKLTDETVWTATTTPATHAADGETVYTSEYGAVTFVLARITEHTFDKEVVDDRYLKSAADCHNAAVYYKTCECGAVGIETFTHGDHLDHVAVEIPAVPATCSSTGLTAGSKCSLCGDILTEQEETEKIAHTIVTDPAFPASCDHEGITEGKHCSVCGEVLIEQKALEKTAHKPGAEATCTTDQTCVVCGEVLAAAHHTWKLVDGLEEGDEPVYEYKCYVTSSSSQDEDGSVSSSTSETEYHARYCAICGEFDKENKVEHTYGEEYVVVTKDYNGHDTSLKKACTVCGHVTTVKATLGYLEYGWTKGETVPATYNEAGYTEYTYDKYTCRLTIDKLVAPYDGKTYRVAEFDPRDNSNRALNAYIWGSVALDANGTGAGVGSPFQNATVTVRMADASTGAVTVAVATESRTVTYNGFVDMATGVIVYGADDSFTRVYLLSPFGTLAISDFSASVFTYDGGKDAMAIEYSYVCNLGVTHHTTVFIRESKAFFGVTFTAEGGSFISAAACYNGNFTVSGNGINESYVYDAENKKMYTADGMQGTWTASFGTVKLSGYGTLTAGEETGTYTVADDKISLTLKNAAGTVTAYYEGTFDADTKTLTVEKPMATVSFDTGDGSDDVINDVTVNVNVPAELSVPTAKASNWSFVGWYTDKEFTDESSVGTTFTATSTAAVTLYAKWINITVTIRIHDAVLGDQNFTTIPGKTYGELLPAYEAGKTFQGMHVFAGYYLDGEFIDELDLEEVTTEDKLEVDIYVKYTDAGSWEFEQGTFTFNYNATSGMWESNNQAQSSKTATIKIYPVGGPIRITFKLYANSEGGSYDYACYYYDEYNYETGEWKTSRVQSAKTGGISTTIDDAISCDVIIPYDANNPTKGVEISYRKDNSGDKGTDTAYIVDLTINGIKIVNTVGTKDSVGGTYTADGKDSLVLNGFGSLVKGEEEGSYEVAAEGAGYSAVAYIADKVYKVTLTGSTYTMEEFRTTLTYNYLDGASADVNETYWYGAKVGTVKEMDKTVDGKVFAGWFTANGTESGEWGNELTADTVMTADLTVYAKWITPHALYGEHHGMGTWGYSAAGSNSGFGGTSDYKFIVDAFGKISGRYTANGFDSYDAETGKFTFTSGGDNYYGHYDKVNGVVAICESTSAFNSSYIDIYVIGATSAKLPSTSGDTCTGCYWNSGKTKLITLPYTKDGVASTINIFVYGDKVYGNVTWTSTDGDVSVRDAYNASQLTVKDSAGSEIVSYVKSASSGLQIPDGSQGTYTAESGETVILNGVGTITIDGVTGTYTVASSSADYGYDVKTADKSYKLTINQEANTCVLTPKALTATFVNDKVTVENQTVYVGIKFTLPTKEAMTVEGFIFRGWYKNEDFSGYNYTTDTVSADVTYYAKYDAAVTLTFDYNGQGTAAVVVPDKYIGDKVSGIPTVPADMTTEDGKVFAGWYSKNGTETGDWGDVASTSVVLTETVVTYYAKWVVPSILAGSYKGYEIYNNYSGTLSVYSKTATIDIFGKINTGSRYGASGTTDGTGYFLMKENSNTYYAYYNAPYNFFVISDSSSTTSFGSDAHFLFKGATTVTCTNTDLISWNDNKSRLIKFTVDGTTINVFINDSEIYVGVSVVDSDNAAVEISSTMVSEGSVITIKNAALENIVTLGYKGGTFVESDGVAGTYTAGDAYGEIVLDGYGNATVNGETVAYILTGSKVSFVAGNAQRIVTIDVGAKTYVKTLDGYEGTYTLPDSTDTVRLDGYGNAGEGKTYIVTGTNVAIYTAGEAEPAKYGIDVEAKAFLGKSVFAGYTFSGTYVDQWYNDEGGTTTLKIAFNDSSDISGRLTLGSNWWFDFTATFDTSSSTLTMTITDAHTDVSKYAGKIITAKVEGNKITILTNGIQSSNGLFSINGGTATCEGFSL